MDLQGALEFRLGLIHHALRGIDGPQVGVVHRKGSVHLQPKPLSHFDGFLDLRQGVVQPALAEIQFSKPAAGLKIVRLLRDEFLQFRHLLVGSQGLFIRFDRGAASLRGL